MNSKSALVTGGSRGIGAGICRALRRDGWTVYFNYSSSQYAADSLAGEIGACAIRADLRSPGEVQSLMEQVGDIDLLVNNAGIWRGGLVQDISDETWEDIFRVNTEAAFRTVRASVPSMIHRKFGNIINISSVWGLYGASFESAYSASKGALISFTKALAKELGPSGIRVNCVCPGVIATDMCACYSLEEMSSLASDTPLGRIGQPEDVAELVTWLASDKSSFLTGQIIGCDGGFGL